MAIYRCGLTTDIGCDREKMEDYAAYRELDDNLLCVIADGTGSREHYYQPATMIVTDFIDNFVYYYEHQREMLLSAPDFFMKKFMLDANKLMGAFKVANEELFSGYGASVTAAFLTPEKKIYVAHCGNTRLYCIRDGHLTQLTQDHTRAMDLLRDGLIDLETYHVHPDRLILTSGIGVVVDPQIDIQKGKIKDNDVLLMTTDGIHYAINPNALTEIVLAAGEPLASSQALIDAAKLEVKYPDNMAAIVIA